MPQRAFRLFVPLLVLLFAGAAAAQDQPTPGPQSPSTYALGPDDQILIRVLDVDEISAVNQTPIRIDSRGNITLPLIGRVQASGLTTEQLEQEIQKRLLRYVQKPDVSVYLTEMRSQPISVLGAVKEPGVHQLQGRKTLFEVISIAGGLREDAGYKVLVTRRLEWGRIPLPDAQDDPTGKYSVASVSVKSIMAATRPEENVEIRPYDVVSVPRAELIYVVGAVKKSGGFVLGENENISALQALSLAEGLDHGCAPGRAKIMRAVQGSSDRQEIAVDLKKVMSGHGPDLPLKAEDILFIPTSGAKTAVLRGLDAAITLGTGIAIYRR